MRNVSEEAREGSRETEEEYAARYDAWYQKMKEGEGEKANDPVKPNQEQEAPGEIKVICKWCHREIREGEIKFPFGLGNFICEKCCDNSTGRSQQKEKGIHQ